MNNLVAMKYEISIITQIPIVEEWDDASTAEGGRIKFRLGKIFSF